MSISFVKWWSAAVVASAILWAPQQSDACAVCLSATDEYRDAFMITTALLTALPLLMIGSLIFWLRQRFMRLERQSEPWPAPRCEEHRPALRAQRQGNLQAPRRRRAQRRP